MSFNAKDVHANIAKLTADDGVFAMKDFDIDGSLYRGFANAPQNMIELLQSGRKHGDDTFIVYEGQRVSFNQFYHQVDILASRLQDDYQIKKGDRIAIAMRNCPEWSIAFVAGAFCGAIMVPLNSWGKTDELIFGLKDCGASLLFCDAQRFALIEGSLDEVDCNVIVANSIGNSVNRLVQDLKSVMSKGLSDNFSTPQIYYDDIAMIAYTSGSTGHPKGVVHRHVAVAQGIMSMSFLGLLIMELEGIESLRGGATQNSPLLTVPLFHGTGLISGLLLPLQLGHKVVLMYKWDTEKALNLIQEEKPSVLTSVPTVLQNLFSHPKYDEYDTRSLFRVSVAGAATPEGLNELIDSKIDNVNRSAGWGMTETMSIGTTMSGGVFKLSPSSSGIKSPLIELRFVATDGQILNQGEIGEIQVRGIVVCAGYWNNPEASAAIMDGDWLKTGDLGYMDADGFLHITGRIKEIVIRGGENIYPGEIENVVYGIEDVLEAVVFGVPDEEMGEALVLVACIHFDSRLKANDIREYLTQKLAKYKVPKYIKLTNKPLPQNASGKLFKRKIRDKFLGSAGT